MGNDDPLLNRVDELLKNGCGSELDQDIVRNQSLTISPPQLEAIAARLVKFSHTALAVFALERAKEACPTSARIAASLARSLYQSGEPILAKIEADRLKEGSESTPETLHILYQLYIDLHSFELAELVAIKLLDESPADKKTRKSLVNCLFELRSFDKVRAHTHLILNSSDVSPEDNLFAARVFARLNKSHDVSLSIQTLRRLEKTGYRFAVSEELFFIETLLADKNRPEANKRALAINKKVETLQQYCDLARIWLTLGKANLALDLAKKWRGTSNPVPDDLALSARLAEVFLESGQRTEANKILRELDLSKIDKREPRSRFLVRRLHEAFFNAQVYDKALITARLGLELSPDDKFFYERTELLRFFKLAIVSEPSQSRVLLRTNAAPYSRFANVIGRLRNFMTDRKDQ